MENSCIIIILVIVKCLNNGCLNYKNKYFIMLGRDKNEPKINTLFFFLAIFVFFPSNPRQCYKLLKGCVE